MVESEQGVNVVLVGRFGVFLVYNAFVGVLLGIERDLDNDSSLEVNSGRRDGHLVCVEDYGGEFH
jgi:hypothetical protein